MAIMAINKHQTVCFEINHFRQFFFNIYVIKRNKITQEKIDKTK